MKRKNLIFVLLIILIFLILASNLKYTGFAIYRVPFNVEIDILNKDKEVNAGEDLRVNIIFYNLLKPRSVAFNYSIQSITGDPLITKQENLFIENETLIQRTIHVPQSAVSGYYLFIINWDEANSKSSSLFKIKSTSQIIKSSLLKILLSIILILITLLLIILIITHNTVLDSLARLDKARLSLFFWKIGWNLKQHNYFIKYIVVFIILCLLAIILILINY